MELARALHRGAGATLALASLVLLREAATPAGSATGWELTSLAEVRWNPIQEGFSGHDKLLHLGAGLLFAAIAVAWLSTRENAPRWAEGTMALAAGMGVLVEALQGLVPGRTPSTADAMAFLVGALVVVSLVYQAREWLDRGEAGEASEAGGAQPQSTTVP